MPYRDPDKQRAYKREWKRMQSAGGGTPGGTVITLPFRLRTAHDVLSLIARHVEAVEQEEEAGTLEKARAIGYLAGIALKAVEITDLGARLAKLEQALGRKGQAVSPMTSLPQPVNGAATVAEEVI